MHDRLQMLFENRIRNGQTVLLYARIGRHDIVPPLVAISPRALVCLCFAYINLLIGADNFCDRGLLYQIQPLHMVEQTG